MRQLRALSHGADVESLLRDPRALTRRELVAASSERALRTAVDTGTVVRLLPNTYVGAEHADSFEARADAAITWAGNGVALTRRAACFAWTLIEAAPAHIDLAIEPHRRLDAPDWLRLHRTPHASTAFMVNGLCAVAPEIALADGYADLTESERVDAVFGGIQRGIFTARELRQALADLPRIRQRRQFTSRVAAAERGAESWLEEVGLQSVFAGKEFDRFLRQHRVRCGDARYRLDMYDPFTRTAVELDSRGWHSSDAHRLRDVRRDADLAAMGILTVRLATHDLVERPQWCREVVRKVLEVRRPA